MPLKRFLIMNFLFVLVATSALITTILDLSKIINVQYSIAKLSYFLIYFTLVVSILYLTFWFTFLTYLLIQRTTFLAYFNSLHRELNQLKNKLKTQEFINFYLSGKINYFYDSITQTWDWKITSGLFKKVKREDWKQYAPQILLLNSINYTLGFFVGIGLASAYSYSTLLPLAITCLFIIWLDLLTCLLRAYPKILPLNHQLIKQFAY